MPMYKLPVHKQFSCFKKVSGKKLSVLATLFCAAILTISSGCGSNDCSKNPLEFAIDEQVLSGYNSIANPMISINASDEIDCYLDYSDGMKKKSLAVSSYYDNLINFLKGRTSVHYYKVGALDNPPEITAGEADFRNDRNYTDRVSKLQPPIDQIVAKKNKTSIFITDFENIQGGIVNSQAPTPFLQWVNKDAWAQNAFKEWIKTGNQIDIFCLKYQMDGLDNWVYALVFTPKAIIQNEAQYKGSLLKHMIESGVTHFSYSTRNFSISQEKKADEIGDANDNIVVQENITKTKDKGFEYYQFSSKDLINFNNDESQKSDRRIINKLKIESRNESLRDVEFGLKVYDVTQSFTDYYCSNNQGTTQVDTNVETGKKDTISKPTTYSYQKGAPVEDVFELVQNSDTKAVGIKLKADFSGVSKKTMYQVDIIVKSVKPKDFSEDNKTLVLNYPNYKVDALARSVELAMKDAALDLENKTVYTIYIELIK